MGTRKKTQNLKRVIKRNTELLPKNVYTTNSGIRCSYTDNGGSASGYNQMGGGALIQFSVNDLNLLMTAIRAFQTTVDKIILFDSQCQATISNNSNYPQDVELFFASCRNDVPESEWSSLSNLFIQPFDNYTGGSSTTSWYNPGITPFDNPTLCHYFKIYKTKKLSLIGGESKKFSYGKKKILKVFNIADYTSVTGISANFVAIKGLTNVVWVQCLGNPVTDSATKGQMAFNSGDCIVMTKERYRWQNFDYPGYQIGNHTYSTTPAVGGWITQLQTGTKQTAPAVNN